MGFGLGLGMATQRPASGPLPAMSLSFLSGIMDPRITFTRASTASYFDSAGVLRSAAVDTPRFDYDPVSLQPRGLLIEGARTNMLLWSKDYSNAYWIKNVPGSLTLTANADVALDGTMTADRFATAAASCGVYRVGVHAGLAIGATVTMSIAIKPLSGYCKIRMGFDGTAFTTAQRGIFDLIAGTDAVFGAANTRKMTLLPNGYWLLSLTAAATAAGDASVSIYAHDATVQSFCVDYSQSEAGAFATSYIPTTAAAITRAADSALMTGTNFSSWYNASEGALIFESQFFGLTPAANDAIVTLLGTNAVTDRIQTFLAGAGPNYRADITSGGVNSFLQNTVNAGDVYSLIRSGIAWSAASSYSCSNKVTSNPTDTAVVVPAVNRLSISAPNSGFHIRSLRYYRTRLSNADLQRLTA